MKISLFRILSFSLLASFLTVSGSLWAHDRPSPTTPGHYTNWGGQIDKLEIVSPFKVADYSRIVVQPLDTSSAPLPKDGDRAYAAVQEALRQATPTLATVLSEAFPKLPVQVEAAGTSPVSGALVVRGKVLTMDPGVIAPVYPANGTGRARTVIAGEVVDGTTGRTLLRFRQERRFSATGDVEDRAVVTTSSHAALVEGGTEGHGVRVVHWRLSAPPSGETALGHNLLLIGGDLADILESF